MSLFSFKKKVKVYIVYSGIQYNIDVSEINFGQTFTEHSYSNKSIQEQNMFEQSVINKANPATFEMNFPAIREGDIRVLFDRALDYKPFDIYVSTKQNVFKVEGCIVTDATFNIQRNTELRMGVSGEGIKVNRLGKRSEVTIPGTPAARSSTRTYNRLSTISILLNGADFSDDLNAITVDLQNDIKWIPYTNTNDALVAIDADTSMYPAEFTLTKRILSGTILKHHFEDVATSNTLFIQVGQTSGQTVYGFTFNIQDAAVTSAINTGEIFKTNYEWRMTQNPDSLSEVISYNTIGGETILDSWNIPILDSLGNPLLESP